MSANTATTNVTSIFSSDVVEAHAFEETLLTTIMSLIDNTSGFNRKQAFYFLGKMLKEVNMVTTSEKFDEVFSYVREEILFRSIDSYAKEKGKSVVTLSEIDQIMRGLLSKEGASLPKLEDRLAIFFVPTFGK